MQKEPYVPELNYLKQDQKHPGPQPFITHVDFRVEQGSADMWLYDIFPGVQLMVSDFHTGSCFRSGSQQNAISINHCRAGRFECEFKTHHRAYMGEGDIAINSELHQPIGSAFPLGHFYGSSIILFPELTQTVPELAAFGISADKLAEKYDLSEQCHVFRRNEAIEHIYSELYAALQEPELTFLRLKILELLYHFQFRQTILEEKRDYLPGALVEKIKHVREHLIGDVERHVGLKELAQAHDLSLTQLKDGFKQVYGQTPYAYLRGYRMSIAARLLRETDRRVGDIALELGYQNLSKFSEAFHSVMGQTPREYRKQNEK